MPGIPSAHLQVGATITEGMLGITKQKRFWNKAARSAMADVLQYHHKHNIPNHFKADARQKYGYMERQKRYKRKKYRVFKSRTDLVAKGKDGYGLMQSITGSYQGPRFSGNFASGVFSGSIAMKMPFPVSGSGGLGVTAEQMKKEISAITQAEADILAKLYAKKLIEYTRAYLNTRGAPIQLTKVTKVF